jgi:hypothetical protein
MSLEPFVRVSQEDMGYNEYWGRGQYSVDGVNWDYITEEHKDLVFACLVLSGEFVSEDDENVVRGLLEANDGYELTEDWEIFEVKGEVWDHKRSCVSLKFKADINWEVWEGKTEEEPKFLERLKAAGFSVKKVVYSETEM